MKRSALWIPFLAALVLTLGLKAVQLGWFAPRPTLELDVWHAPARGIRIDMDQRPDLARQFDVIRAPTLVLLNVEGQAVWRQDEGLSDESPLDLNQAERQIEALTINP
jgi:hypothetical protein